MSLPPFGSASFVGLPPRGRGLLGIGMLDGGRLMHLPGLHHRTGGAAPRLPAGIGDLTIGGLGMCPLGGMLRLPPDPPSPRGSG